MGRRLLVAIALAAGAGTILWAVPAGAGGFCSGLDGARYSDERGTVVRMADNCFSPTVLRVDVGDAIVFENADLDAHAVGGTTGTFGDMHKEIAAEETVTYTFEQEGVFPYVCILHPGMAGAIVVGDGAAEVLGTNGAAASLQEPAGRQGSLEPTSQRAETPWGLGLAVVIIAGLVAGLVTVLGRRRKKAVTPASRG